MASFCLGPGYCQDAKLPLPPGYSSLYSGCTNGFIGKSLKWHVSRKQQSQVNYQSTCEQYGLHIRCTALVASQKTFEHFCHTFVTLTFIWSAPTCWRLSRHSFHIPVAGIIRDGRGKGVTRLRTWRSQRESIQVG